METAGCLLRCCALHHLPGKMEHFATVGHTAPLFLYEYIKTLRFRSLILCHVVVHVPLPMATSP
jgi:hypothetical protein